MVIKTKETAGTQLVFETSTKIDIRNIKPNPYQPDSRIIPPAEALSRVAASIKEHGLIQTPVARIEPGTAPGLFWEMGDGWIRRCAYERLAIETKDASWYFMPVNVRELTDRQMADLIVEANMVRLDLSPIDLARFYVQYLEDFKVTQTELARLHNCTQGEIANTIRLLDLPDDIQAKVISQEISETHARQFLRINDKPELQKEMLEEVIKEGTSVNELSNGIQRAIYENSENLDESEYPKPEFDTAACEKCPNRQKIGSPYRSEDKTWRCVDKACFKEKTEQFEKDKLKKIQAEIAAAQAKTGPKVQKAEAVIDLGKMKYGTYESLDDNYRKIDKTECKSCPKRAVGKRGYGGPVSVCIDVKCYKKKEKEAKEKENAKLKEAENKLTERVKAAAELGGEDPGVFALIGNYLLTRSRKDTREKFARMLEMKEHELMTYAFNCIADDKVLFSRFRILVLTMERFEGDKGIFKKMLADLEGTGDEVEKELDALRAKRCKGCANDNNDCKSLISAWGNGRDDTCYSKAKVKAGKSE